MPEESPVTHADLPALVARIEKSETNLLNAFRRDLRLGTSTNAVNLLLKSFDARLAFVEQRLVTQKQRFSQLERGN